MRNIPLSWYIPLSPGGGTASRFPRMWRSLDCICRIPGWVVAKIKHPRQEAFGIGYDATEKNLMAYGAFTRYPQGVSRA